MPDLLETLKKFVQPKPGRARKRQGSVLALEIGTSRIKMAVLARRDGRLSLERFGWRALEKASLEERSKKLKDLLEEIKPPGLEVATSVTGPSVAVRYIQLPKMTQAEVKSAVQFEAEKYIPFKIEEVILDSQVLHEEGGKLKVLLVAARKAFVEELVAVLGGAGLVPVLVDVDSFCLVNAFEENYGAPPGTVALVHIGAASTNVNVFRDGTLSFTRDIPIAGQDATRVISEKLSVPAPEAERLKIDPGKKKSEVRLAQQPFFDNFLNEIRLSFDFYENQFEKAIDRVWLSGGSARSEELMQVLHEGLHLELGLWNPFEKVGISPDLNQDEIKEWAPSLGVCVGLAVRGS